MDRDEIVLLLPEIFQRTYLKKQKDAQEEAPAGLPTRASVHGNVLSALLDVMECLHAPDETILEDLDHYFDPEKVPAEKQKTFLPFLARWVDLDWLLPASGAYEAGLGCLRDLILSAPRLASIRGTGQGLAQFLEVATGLPGYQVEDDPARPFHIIIHCPPGAGNLRPLVERIVAGEKPVYVKCKLIFPEQVILAGASSQESSASPIQLTAGGS